jgi:hypothetical protein
VTAEDSAVAEHISARFQLTASRLYISAKYHDVVISVSWLLTDKEYERHVKTLLFNMPDLIKDGAQEMVVRRELLGIDAELDHLFREDRGE